MRTAWLRLVDGRRSGRWDVLDAAVCLTGMAIAFCGPRGTGSIAR